MPALRSIFSPADLVSVPLLFGFAAGMVATVNPCGFAMLPAYVSVFLTGEEAPSSDGSAVANGLRVGGWVTVGFIAVFTVVGIITTAVSQSILDLVPWAAIAIGVALAALGVAVLTGKHLRVPALNFNFSDGGSSPRSLATFGVAYGVASISCTLPVFLAIATQALAAASLIDGVAIFASYGFGMGIVLVAVAVALATSRDALVQRMRRLLPVVERIGGWLLVASGIYIVYYWTANLAVPVGSDSVLLVPSHAVERVSFWFSRQIGDNALTWLVLLVGFVVLLVTLERTRRKRGTHVPASYGRSTIGRWGSDRIRPRRVALA